MWKYIGYGGYYYGSSGYKYFWSNAAGGGNDIAWVYQSDYDCDNALNTPPAHACFSYGELENYRGDLIAFCNDNDITRDDL